MKKARELDEFWKAYRARKEEIKHGPSYEADVPDSIEVLSKMRQNCITMTRKRVLQLAKAANVRLGDSDH